jgi:hypothetical protein
MYAQPNEHGAYPPDQCEVIETEGRSSSVRIMLAHAGPDAWIPSTSVRITGAGWGSYPGTGRKQYPTRQAALAAAHDQIIADCEAKIRNASTRSMSQSAEEVIRLVDAQKRAQMQMTLF